MALVGQLRTKVKKALQDYGKRVTEILAQTVDTLSKLPVDLEEEVFELTRRTLERADTELLEALLEERQIYQQYTANDLRVELGLWPREEKGLGITMSIPTLALYVNRLLQKKQDSEIYAPVGIGSTEALADFPNGFRLGRSEIVTIEDLPTKVRERAAKDPELAKYPRWIKRYVGIAGPEKALVVGESAIARDLDVHRFLTTSPYVRSLPLELPFYIYHSPSDRSTTSTSRYSLLPYGPYSLLATWGFVDDMQRLNRLYDLPEPTDEIVKRLRGALTFIGLTTTAADATLKIGLLVAALEGLLLPGEPGPQYRVTLSQRAAILSQRSRGERLQAYKQFLRFYDQRSGVFHGSQPEVGESDYSTLVKLCHNVFWKVYELHESGVVTFDKLVQWLENRLFVAEDSVES